MPTASASSHTSVMRPQQMRHEDDAEQTEDGGGGGVDGQQSLHRRLRVLSVVESDCPSSVPSPPGGWAPEMKKRRRGDGWAPPLQWLWLCVALLSGAVWGLSSPSQSLVSVWNVAVLEDDGQLVLASHVHSASCSAFTRPLLSPHFSLLRHLVQGLHVGCLSVALALSSVWWAALLNSLLCLGWRLWEGRRGQTGSRWLIALARCTAFGFMAGQDNTAAEAAAKGK